MKRLSHRTAFYIREYGPHAHVAGNIMRESVKVLLLASLISSLGGIGLEAVREKFLLIVPLVILLPALNDMIGDFGTVVSSKFTMALYRGWVKEKWWRSHFVRDLIQAMILIALISAVYVGSLAWGIAYLQGQAADGAMLVRMVEVSVIATVLLTGIIMLISIVGGLAIYRRKEDPNNFLIPITTSIADFGSLLLLTAMVVLLF